MVSVSDACADERRRMGEIVRKGNTGVSRHGIEGHCLDQNSFRKGGRKRLPRLANHGHMRWSKGSLGRVGRRWDGERAQESMASPLHLPSFSLLSRSMKLC